MANTNDIPYRLTPAQAVSFHRDGFLLLDDVLTPVEVKHLQQWTAEVVGGLCFDWRLDYVNYHSGFNDLFRGKRLTGILSELMGEPAVLFKEKVSVPASFRFYLTYSSLNVT